MGHRDSPDEKRKTMLRTTADILNNAVLQMDWCIKDWPEYQRERDQLKELSDRIVADARGVGYVGRGNQRV